MGTPGHMAHPFDVERVQTGQDLVDYINSAVSRLAAGEIAGSVKWDGINTSFKLVTDENGKKDFRMDRGTNHIDSVIGLTAADAYEKWPEGHGMPPAIEKLLSIFNAALPLIEPELKELGLWNDSTKYFNTEYITSAEEGPANVQEYADNILAIHGINQFYEKKAQPHAIRKGTSMDRPGMPRPIGNNGKPIKGGGIEIPYNHAALKSLIKKVQPYAEKYGFKIYGDVPVKFDDNSELDLEKVLETPVEIQITTGNVKKLTLREWLQAARHPKDKRVTKVIRDQNGNPTGTKDVGALSKDIYMAVLRSATNEGVALSDYLQNPDDIKHAINGGIFYHATRLLGQAVKKALTSQAGSLGRHEGVVLRGMEDFLVKLTGDFIVQGLASTHGTHVKESLSNFTIQISKDRQVTKTISEWLVEIKNANHTYQKPPQFVYKDILTGTPIVEIVSQENAEKTIYNTIITYVNNLREEVIDDKGKDVEIPIIMKELEDEDEDPVIDIEFEDEPVENTSPQTIAIVPGAYKPPHKGHLDMVIKYLTGEGISVPKADKVIVIISKPTKAGRYLPDGTEVGTRESLALWDQLIGGMPGVDVQISEHHASPINAGYELVGEGTKIPSGTNIILGASQKGNDWRRWSGAEKYVSESLNLVDPENSAVPPKEHDDGYIETLLKEENSNLYKGLPSVKSGKNPNEYHASDFRYMIGEAASNPVAKKLLESYIGEGNVKMLLTTFGIPTDLEEMSVSSAVQGAPAAGGGPWQEEDIPKENEEEAQRSRLVTRGSLAMAKENIDLSTVDEVMRLIMERGILR